MPLIDRLRAPLSGQTGNETIKTILEDKMCKPTRVKVVHWWPGREYEHHCPIPPWLVRQAEQRGSRYLTYASFGNDIQVWSGSAFCCPKDTPSRRVGRNIALGRLKATAEKAGVELPF